jgi:hypothetical protein
MMVIRKGGIDFQYQKFLLAHYSSNPLFHYSKWGEAQELLFLTHEGVIYSNGSEN